MGYTLHDYAKDIENADKIYFKEILNECVCPITNTVHQKDEQELDAIKKKALAIKAQFLGAAGKRLRSDVVVDLLDGLKKSEWDITPTLAVAVARNLLGRGVNRKMLMERYATKGRTAANKADKEQLSNLNEHPRFIKAEKELEERLKKAKIMRAQAQKKYKNSEAYKLLAAAHK